MANPGVEANDVRRGEAKRSRASQAALALALVGLALVLYVLFAAVSKPDKTGVERFAANELRSLRILDAPPPQPRRAFSGPAGEARSLADLRGKVLLLNVWASWCAPCIEEMPTLAALDGRFADRGFEVVAVSIDTPRDADKARKLLDRLTGGALEFQHDPTGGIAWDLAAGGQPQGLPTSVLYDRNGVEIARLAGGADWNGPMAHALVEHALATP